MYLRFFLLVTVTRVLRESSGSFSGVRGLRPELAAFYDPGRDSFQCLDGGQVIPFDQVNDDYCDCQDGSDEPGTAACSNGSFYCSNEGHVFKVMTSSRVNDGICDCCDGSDEWAAKTDPERSPCENVCNEMGAAARIEAERKAAVFKEGMVKREELIKLGKELKEQKLMEIEELEQKLGVAKDLEDEKDLKKQTLEDVEKEFLDKYRAEKDAIRQQREEEEKAADEQKAMDFFGQLDTNDDGTVSKMEMVMNTVFDQNGDGTVSDEEVNFYLSGNEEYSAEDFVSSGWPMIKPLLQDKKQNDDKEQKPEDVDYNDEHLDQIDYEEYPDEADENLDGEVHAPEPIEEKNDQPDDYDEETRKAVDEASAARSEYEAVHREVRDIETKIEKLKSSVEKDYGKDEEYAALADQCYEYTDAEYVYKICLFDSCTQKSKNGGSETRLGKWDRWESNTSEEEQVMYYSGGANCWNGPARSTKVFIRCGTEVNVLSVSEPSKCEYVMTMEAPSACSKQNNKNRHDEL